MKKENIVSYLIRNPYYNFEELGLKILQASMARQFTWRTNNFTAPYWRFYWNPNGRGVVTWKDNRVKLDKNLFFIIPPDTDYQGDKFCVMDHFYIIFTCFAPYDRAKEGIYSIKPTNEYLSRAEELALWLDKSHDAPGSIAKQLAFYELIIYALSALPESAMIRSVGDETIKKICQYIKINLAGTIDPASLASQGGIGLRTLYRKFHDEFGTSPAGYIREQRINEASLLLQFTGKSISEIATLTGFSDRYHFTRVFSRYRNISPAAFRKNILKQH